MTSFPWWLWLLAGCWAALLVGRWQLPRDSEWLRGANVLLVVYTFLLAALAIQRVWILLPANSPPVHNDWLLMLAAGAALLGGLSAVCTQHTTWESGGRIMNLAGLTALTATCGAYELTLLLVLLCTLTAFRRHHSAPPTTPLTGETAWFVGCLTLLAGVLAIGLLPELVVTLPAVPTAIPNSAQGTLLSWESLLLVGVLVWLQARPQGIRERSDLPGEQSRPFVEPGTGIAV